MPRPHFRNGVADMFAVMRVSLNSARVYPSPHRLTKIDDRPPDEKGQGVDVRKTRKPVSPTFDPQGCREVEARYCESVEEEIAEP
jgi:hypothetical protein